MSVCFANEKVCLWNEGDMRVEGKSEDFWGAVEGDCLAVEGGVGVHVVFVSVRG